MKMSNYCNAKNKIFIVYNLIVKSFINADVFNPKTSFIFFTNNKFLFFFLLNSGVKCELDAFFYEIHPKSKTTIAQAESDKT